MKKLYTAFLLVLLAALLGVGIYSLADQDAAGSASEKREFVKPEFSVRARRATTKSAPARRWSSARHRSSKPIWNRTRNNAIGRPA